MRLKIIRQPSGEIDGIPLSDLNVDVVYDIGTTLGSYLLAEGLAEPAPDDAAAHVAPLSSTRFAVFGGTERPLALERTVTRPPPLSEAADRPPRRPRQKPRRAPARTGSKG